MANPAVIWPDEHIDALREFVVAKAGSATKIADLMTEKFETRFTRNKICGKIHRLGLSEPKPKEPKQPRPKRHQPYKPRRKPEAPPPETVALRCVEIVPLNITLQELDDTTCKYPYGDRPPFQYCGHPSLPDESWCLDHFHLCRRAGA